MLNLRYGPVPVAMLEMMEHHGRGLGLPLSTIEAIGQQLDLVESFIVECEEGRGDLFAGFVTERAVGAVAVAARVRLPT